MDASVDVGSNTVRMLIGRTSDRRVVPLEYRRRITRLGGGYTPAKGLALDARQRTLEALREFADRIAVSGIDTVRAVGTEAFRKAVNGKEFAETIRSATGLPLRIITGEEEALLTARGVRSALDPQPRTSLIFDLGGGSTEFILCRNGRIAFRSSYPIGVVSLREEAPTVAARQRIIERSLVQLVRDLDTVSLSLPASGLTLVGTAGTVTTLAAIHLKMVEYDWRRINNLELAREDLKEIAARLVPLSSAEREKIPGMEEGRGDLILPGLQFVQTLMSVLGRRTLRVSDFGLLEGLQLEALDPSPKAKDSQCCRRPTP